MSKTFLACTLALAILPARAWGVQGHALAASTALKDLPPALAPWFAGLEAVLPDHASDPDRWKDHDPLERPRHYLNCEPYGGAAQVPFDEGAAQAMLGPEAFQTAGQVPWVVLERVQQLAQAFSDGDRERVALEASFLCHYVADLQVPLHTTTNHDGSGTGQKGVHHHWESGLVERIVSREGWQPDTRRAVLAPDPARSPWSWLQESNNLVPGVLADDLSARRASAPAREPEASSVYWQVFLQLQEPHVKEQLTLAAQRTAEMILYAWNQAGSPTPASRSRRKGLH